MRTSSMNSINVTVRRALPKNTNSGGIIGLVEIRREAGFVCERERACEEV